MGYSVNPEFDAAKNSNKFSIFETTSTDPGIRMLLKGRVDSFINGREVVLYQAHQMGVGKHIAVLQKPMHEPRPAYFMFSKAAKIDNKVQLIQSLKQSLAQMWVGGTVKRITDTFTRPTVTVIEPAH